MNTSRRGFLTVVVLLALATLAHAQGDPLPSRNDGPNKRALVEFVTRVTNEGGPDFVPVPQRIAAFDNDGTLRSEQPIYFQFAFALDRVKALAPSHPEWKTQQPFKAVLDGDMRALIFYCADNGASGEGSPSGSVNENRFFNGYPDDIASNIAMIDTLGSPNTYNHYPTGWAVAFSTPYKMFKRYASFAGGTCDPLVIHWPRGIKSKGELRHQYHHCTDIMPTILECCGIEMPETIDGIQQSALAGVSMRYSFDNAKTPTRKETQYYEMVGTRGIWHHGWKAATLHAPIPSDQGNFDKDVWQLFNVEEDCAEAHDLAAQHPDKLKQLQELWTAEAEKNNVFPLIDVGVALIHELEFHAAPPASGRYVYYPGTTEVPEATAARTLGSSFKALAEVEFTGDSQGVIFAQGSRFGGYSLFVKGGKLIFVYNFLGIPPEQRLATDAPSLGTHIVGVEFTKKSISKNLETLGQMKLYVDDKVVAEAPFRTQSGHYALCGEGLSIGTDTGDSVSSDYQPKFEFTGGRVIKVVFDVAKNVYVDVEKAMAASMARD